MVAYPYTYALPPGCATAPTAVRFAALLETSSNAQITITAGRAVTASVARVFFRGQQLVSSLVASTDAVGLTSATAGNAACTSYDLTKSPFAFDDLFVEVIGKGDGTFAISAGPTVWGNHYLSQPVFSQTVTT